MKDRKTVWISILGLVTLAAFFAFAGSGAGVEYPEGYREWVHVKSMLIEEGHPLFDSFGGIHHLYANEAALAGYRGQHPFPDGSVIVFDLLEAKREGNAVTEGARKIVGVMVKDAKRFATTGGWGFEGFKGDGRERAVTDAKKQCFACHAAQRANDFVFSDYRR